MKRIKTRKGEARVRRIPTTMKEQSDDSPTSQADLTPPVTFGSYNFDEADVV